MKRIIFIDDSDDCLNLYKIYLKKEELFEGFFVKSPLDALELIKTERIDLAFVDIEMPELNGFETLEQIKALTDKFSIVALTGHAGGELIEKIASSRFDSHLVKPVKKSTLMEKINSLVGND